MKRSMNAGLNQGMGMKKGEGIFGPGMKVSKQTKQNLLSTKVTRTSKKTGGVNMSLWTTKTGKKVRTAGRRKVKKMQGTQGGMKYAKFSDLAMKR